jgi:hypothetical protein
MVEGDEAEPKRNIAMKEEHFNNLPMFMFTSDSPNIMMKLCRLAVESNEFLFVMGVHATRIAQVHRRPG